MIVEHISGEYSPPKDGQIDMIVVHGDGSGCIVRLSEIAGLYQSEWMFASRMNEIAGAAERVYFDTVDITLEPYSDCR